MQKVVGVDLGTTNSVVAVIDGATALPSVLRSYVSVASTAAS